MVGREIRAETGRREEARAGASPRGGETGGRDPGEEMILRAFARIDSIALGVAVGLWFASAVCVATLILVLQGGPLVGPNLNLLSQYYPGYRVTGGGALLGFAYGFATGFALGWTIASVRNGAMWLYVRFAQKRAQLSTLDNYLDRL